MSTVHLLPLYPSSKFTPCGEPLPAVFASTEIEHVTCDKCQLLHDDYCDMMNEKEEA